MRRSAPQSGHGTRYPRKLNNDVAGGSTLGYNLHITRAKFHFDNAGHWITTEEWLRCVEQDPELRLAGYNGDYFAIWTGKSEYPDPWLDWSEGNIHTKNPDDPLIDKMVEIAKKLNAKVQGDDGEIYTGGGSKHFLPAPEPDTPPASTDQKRGDTPKSCWAQAAVKYAIAVIGGLFVAFAVYFVVWFFARSMVDGLGAGLETGGHLLIVFIALAAGFSSFRASLGRR